MASKTTSGVAWRFLSLLEKKINAPMNPPPSLDMQNIEGNLTRE